MQDNNNNNQPPAKMQINFIIDDPDPSDDDDLNLKWGKTLWLQTLKIKSVIHWLEQNHAFFSAALKGDLHKWLVNQSSDDQFFQTCLPIVKHFTERLRQSFSHPYVHDVRLYQYESDPWGCFLHCTVGSNDEIIRSKKIESNLDFALLELFLTRNFYITDCLYEELPKLNPIAARWEDEQFNPIAENVADWLESNRDFFATLLNGDFRNWCKDRKRLIMQDCDNVVEGHTIPKEIKDDPKNERIVIDMEGKKIENAYKQLEQMKWLKQAWLKFQNDLSEAFDCPPDSNENCLVLLSLTRAALVNFLTDHLKITKLLAKNLPTFDYTAHIWKTEKAIVKTKNKPKYRLMLLAFLASNQSYLEDKVEQNNSEQNEDQFKANNMSDFG